MSDNTIIQQGSFTSAGVAVNIPLRSGVDWMKVYNTTVATNAQTTAVGVEYYWQLGFPAGYAWEYKKAGAGVAGANLVTYNSSAGFTYYDSSLLSYGVIKSTITAISTAAQPVVTNSGTNGLSAGQVVRLFNVAGAKELNAIDYTVGQGTLSTTTFSLDFANQLQVAGTTGSFMLVNSSPIFYPSNRVISIATAIDATELLLTFTVTHSYKVGQILRLNFSPAYGAWSQLNGVQATITAIDNSYPQNDVSLAVDATSLGSFPSSAVLLAAYPYTAASVVPVGEDTALALADGLNVLGDATINQSSIGMTLAAGANSPAGVTSDVIFWVAGKSFSNNGL